MTHIVRVNRSGKVKRHPITEKIIHPGQSYSVPAESAYVELVDTDLPTIGVQTITASKNDLMQTESVKT